MVYIAGIFQLAALNKYFNPIIILLITTS